MPLTVIHLCSLLGGWLLLSVAHGMQAPYPGPHIENRDLLVVLRPLTAEQTAAFYEARGFPREAIDIIKSTCFVTVHVRNRGKQVIWLDTGHWSFTHDGKPLRHLDKSWWDAQWARIDLRQASRSTFGWTQLPLQRDLQPDEPVGGNIVLPGDTRRFDMTLRMATGADRRGEPVILEFSDVECPQAEADR